MTYSTYHSPLTPHYSAWRPFHPLRFCFEAIARFANRLDLPTQAAKFPPQRLDVDINGPLQNHGVRHEQPISSERVKTRPG